MTLDSSLKCVSAGHRTFDVRDYEVQANMSLVEPLS